MTLAIHRLALPVLSTPSIILGELCGLARRLPLATRRPHACASLTNPENIAPLVSYTYKLHRSITSLLAHTSEKCRVALPPPVTL